MQIVKESLDDGYCDISGNLGDITCVGELNTLYQPLLSQTMVSKGIWGKSDSFVPRVRPFEYL
jgi:hypothetical protein